MTKRPYGLVILFCFLALTLAPLSDASRVRSFGFKELVEQSAVVLTATVVGKQFRVEPTSGEPFTDVTVRILDVIKGAGELKDPPNKQLVLPFSGGMTDKGELEVVFGMPAPAMGETYLLFLRGGQWSVNPITGWHQGMFRLIAYDARGSHMLFNVHDEVLMDVRDDRLIFQGTKPAAPQAQERKEGEQQRPSMSLQQDVDLSKVQEALKDSIYREGNRDNLAKEDEKRAASRQSEKRQRVSREERIKALLGREPFLLSNFSALIRQVPESANPEQRTFNARPLASGKGEGEARKTK